MKTAKTILSVLLALVMLLSLGSLAYAGAEGTTDVEIAPNYIWTITQNSTATETGTATAVLEDDPTQTESMVIPARGTAVEVGYCGTGTNHAYYALYDDNTLFVFGEGKIVRASYGDSAYPVVRRNIIIDEGITEIGELAFAEWMLRSVTVSVTLPDSLTTIGPRAFHCCLVLSEINFGKNLESIGDEAFAYCNWLIHVVLPDSLTSLGAGVFKNDAQLASVLLPAGITEVKSELFSDSKRLQAVLIYNKDAVMAEDCLGGQRISPPTICSYPGGSVEAFANEHNYRFADLSEMDSEGHLYDEGMVAQSPTCTEDGVTVKYCVICGWADAFPIPATGHTWDDGVVTTQPTCTEAGERTYTCTLCGDTKTETIPANGHAFGEWQTVREATLFKTGEEKRVCGNDPTHIETRTIPRLSPLDWLRDLLGKLFGH